MSVERAFQVTALCFDKVFLNAKNNYLSNLQKEMPVFPVRIIQ